MDKRIIVLDPEGEKALELQIAQYEGAAIALRAMLEQSRQVRAAQEAQAAQQTGEQKDAP